MSSVNYYIITYVAIENPFHENLLKILPMYNALVTTIAIKITADVNMRITTDPVITNIRCGSWKGQQSVLHSSPV